MSTTTKQKTLLAASAAAISAIGLLTSPALAQAHPMIPLAPACTQYGFTGNNTINMSNGARIEYTSTGERARGEAVSFRDGDVAKGPITGHVDGRTVNLTVRWIGGTAQILNGTVDDSDFAHGNTWVEGKDFQGITWDSGTPLGCLSAPPPAAPVQCPLGSQTPTVPAGAQCAPPPQQTW